VRSWQNGLAVFALTFFGLLLLGALLGRRVGLAALPAAIQVAGIMVIAPVAGVASAIVHAARRRRRLRDWQVRLARVDASLSGAQAAGDAASGVTETVTVELRRQIPPRPDEPPRSWLGGLPMLPDGVAWPRSVSSEDPDGGERPLHFIAQICCADLPPDLWAGLGPRHGWLLLFIDPNQGAPQGPDAFCILHTDELGSERTPPIDLGPVHDGVHTGWDYQDCGGGEGIPRLWNRWPVDLVAMPNVLSGEGRTVRPHRMGGYHDGVQSDATKGPTQHVLLFQVASDAAMQWCWGDIGAYYIFISPADLRHGDFERASIVLECH
jgi:hypothetical protein